MLQVLEKSRGFRVDSSSSYAVGARRSLEPDLGVRAYFAGKRTETNNGCRVREDVPEAVLVCDVPFLSSEVVCLVHPIAKSPDKENQCR